MKVETQSSIKFSSLICDSGDMGRHPRLPPHPDTLLRTSVMTSHPFENSNVINKQDFYFIIII